MSKPMIDFTSYNVAPIVEFRANGDLYVRGNLVTNDAEIVDSLRSLLADYGQLRGETDRLRARVALLEGQLARLVAAAAAISGDARGAMEPGRSDDNSWALGCSVGDVRELMGAMAEVAANP